MKKHFQQLVSGLMAMHEMCIVHRDLKCENVLLDRNNNIKIAGIIYLFKQLYMSNISWFTSLIVLKKIFIKQNLWKWPKGHFVSELTDLFIHLNILDFGFARFADVESLLKTICGSFIYTAPELIAGRQEYSGYLTDCWSIGVILYCMLCRKLPFSKDDLMQMANGRGLLQGLDFPSHISHGNLLFFCLHYPIPFCYSFKVSRSYFRIFNEIIDIYYTFYV